MQYTPQTMPGPGDLYGADYEAMYGDDDWDEFIDWMEAQDDYDPDDDSEETTNRFYQQFQEYKKDLAEWAAEDRLDRR